MAECETTISNFYPNYSFVTDPEIMSPDQAAGYVSLNLESNDNVPNDEPGMEKESILSHERCYLQGNLLAADGSQVYTDGSFYKSSSMIEDLNLYATTGDWRNGNVCGQGQYIYTDINPSTGETIEECQTCGTPPPGKENLDYNITTRIVTDSSFGSSDGFVSGELKIRERQRQGDQSQDITNLGTIQLRGVKDFEQDYTMYRYDIANQEQLSEVTNEDGVLQSNFDITDRAKATYEEHDLDGVPNNKLNRDTFLDVQKQCSPLISDWFPSQHGRNIERRRTEIFDTNTIQYADTSTRRATDLLQGDPIDIMDFFNREYNSLPELDGLEEHKITREMLTENAPNSIINNIRILDIGPPITNEQTSTEAYIGKLKSCPTTVDLEKCALLGTNDGSYYYKTIPEELARAWIAKKLDNIRRATPLTQDGNIASLYGDLNNMFTNVDPQIEECINDIVGTDGNSQEMIANIERANGDFTKFTDREIQYLRRKIVMFIHSPDERVRECIDMMYMNSAQNLCTEGLYNKTLKILTVLFSLLSVNIELSDIETNDAKYNSVMNFIDSLGDLFPRAIEKIIGIVQDLEKDLCNTSNKSDIIVNLYDDLINKNRKYNIEMGMFGQLFSLDDNQFSRIVDTYNMISPVLGRLFGPTVQS